MDLTKAILDPRINVFDIEPLPNGKWNVTTYLKPGESQTDFAARHQKNIQKVKELKTRKPEEKSSGFIF